MRFFVNLIQKSIMSKVILYHYESPDIKITTEAYFDSEKLIIEGYDIGKRVEEVWGDSDYEYMTTISPEELKKLYPLMNVLPGDKDGLLNAIADKYNTNSCYSEFNGYLVDNHIDSEGFS
jgi:hypothetical protein